MLAFAVPLSRPRLWNLARSGFCTYLEVSSLSVDLDLLDFSEDETRIRTISVTPRYPSLDVRKPFSIQEWDCVTGKLLCSDERAKKRLPKLSRHYPMRDFRRWSPVLEIFSQLFTYSRDLEWRADFKVNGYKTVLRK